VDELVKKFKVRRQKPSDFDIDVYFHVILSSTGKGDLTDDVINQNMGYLNEGFSGNLVTYNTDCKGNTVSGRESSIRFKLIEITRTTNDKWYNVEIDDDDTQEDMGNSLRRGGCDVMNVYSISESSGYSWATLPMGCDRWSAWDGVFMIDKEFDGHLGSYGEGSDTFIHEAGHWVGLDHVFEGGCDSGEGDGVADTPPQTETSFDCPVNKDTCKGGGVDSITNYMDYSENCCMHEFSEGQVTRVHALLEEYRSSDGNGNNDNGSGGNDGNGNNDDYYYCGNDDDYRTGLRKNVISVVKKLSQHQW